MDHVTRLFIAYDFGVNRCTVNGFDILMLICKQTARHNISKLARFLFRSRNAYCISQSSGSICLNSCCAASIWAVFKKPCWLMINGIVLLKLGNIKIHGNLDQPAVFFGREKKRIQTTMIFGCGNPHYVDTEVPCFATINLYFWCSSECVIMDGFLPRPAP